MMQIVMAITNYFLNYNNYRVTKNRENKNFRLKKYIERNKKLLPMGNINNISGQLCEYHI